MMSHSQRLCELRKMPQLLRRRDLVMVAGFFVIAGFLSLVVYPIGVHPLPQFFSFFDVVSILN